jgi:hypothetical protein
MELMMMVNRVSIFDVLMFWDWVWAAGVTNERMRKLTHHERRQVMGGAMSQGSTGYGWYKTMPGVGAIQNKVISLAVYIIFAGKGSINKKYLSYNLCHGAIKPF